MPANENSVKSTAPEGGWGWWVVIGYSLNNMIVISTLQVFGLLYLDLLKELEMSAVDISIIITTNCSFGMLMAIFNGPILRLMGFRKVGIIGAILIFVGNLMTSRSNNFLQFFFYYGIIVSIGTDLVMAAFHLALNTYFVSKRGIATGIAMSFTGIGPVFMPLIVSALLGFYGVRGTGLITSALSLHSLAAALLLQPVKWHRKKLAGEKEEENINAAAQPKKESEQKMDCNDQNDDDPTPDTKLMADEQSMVVIETAKKINQKDIDDDESKRPLKSLDDVVKREYSVLSRIVQFFDLDLLRDPIYLNISLGLTIAYVGEMSFSLMLPFILDDRKLEKGDIAIFMSLLAVADIASRFISPFVGHSVKSKVRVVYLIGLLSGIIIRVCLIYSHNFVWIMAVSFGLGISKGIRSVYTALVIPGYVPLHKLASATGLQMVMNGIFLLIFGPLLGKIKDGSNNYNIWLHVVNCFGLVTVILWCVEMCLLRQKTKSDKKSKTPIVRNMTPR